MYDDAGCQEERETFRRVQEWCIYEIEKSWREPAICNNYLLQVEDNATVEECGDRSNLDLAFHVRGRPQQRIPGRGEDISIPNHRIKNNASRRQSLGSVAGWRMLPSVQSKTPASADSFALRLCTPLRFKTRWEATFYSTWKEDG